jgi:signal transduction histidine kinase
MTEEGGFGLFSIRERMTFLGGRLELRSESGKGTTAILRAPLKVLPRAEAERVA